MPHNKDFALRIEILDSCLRNTLRKWTLENLIHTVSQKLQEKYGKSASRRTVQDDLKYMIEIKEAPIKKRKEGTTTFFYYEDPNYSIKNLPIKEDEINLLLDVVNILRQVKNFKILKEVEDIVHKLQNTANTNIEGNLAILQFEQNDIAAGAEYIDDIFTAIKEKVALRITYQPFDAIQSAEYEFHPYLLKEYRNRWFILGRKGESDTITNLALDRIIRLRNTRIKYIPNDLFDIDTYFENLIGVSIPKNSNVQVVDINVSKKQAPYIRTKPIHHTQRIIKEYKNGSILIRAHLISNYELKSVLLSYGDSIKVIRPITLKEEMKQVLMHAYQNYL